MPSHVYTKLLPAPVANGGSIVFTYKAGAEADDYKADGHYLYSSALQGRFTDDGGISVVFGETEITVTYDGATTIPANSKVSFNAETLGIDTELEDVSVSTLTVAGDVSVGDDLSVAGDLTVKGHTPGVYTVSAAVAFNTAGIGDGVILAELPAGAVVTQASVFVDVEWDSGDSDAITLSLGAVDLVDGEDAQTAGYTGDETATPTVPIEDPADLVVTVDSAGTAATEGRAIVYAQYVIGPAVTPSA